MESPNQSSVTEFIFLALAKSTRYPALLSIIFLLLYVVIISGNILMILVIKVDQKLHTPMYFFVFNLSCLDICYTTTIVPQTLSNLLNSRHSILFHNCVIQMFCMIIFGALQILIITVMAYDRYVAIGNPLRYKIVMRWSTCTKLLGITWITSFIIAFVAVYSVFRLPFCGKHEIDHFYCDVGQVLLLTCPNTKSHRLSEFITFFTGFGLFTIPFLLLVTSYVYIISAILKIRTNEGRRKAFSTCSSHITVVVVEYACLGFIYFRPSEAYSLDKDKVFVMTFTFVTPIINPVVYTVRNKAIKKGFIKLISTKIC